MRVSKFFRTNLVIFVIGLPIMFILNMLFPFSDSKETLFDILTGGIWISVLVFGAFGSFIATIQAISGNKDKYVFMPSAVLMIGVCFAFYQHYNKNEALAVMFAYIIAAITLLSLHIFFPDYMEKRYHGGHDY